jgi:ketosteroid isomerase-like protein
MANAESKSDPEGFGRRTVQLFDAMKARDVAALDAMLAARFVFTTFVGTTGTRAQYMDVLAKKIMNIDAYKLEPVGVEVYGDAAVVVYHLLIQATANGQPWPGHLISTDTWVKQGGSWKLAARHSSVVATPR